MSSFDDDNKSLLDKLDTIAPIREFDAFPKVANNYTTRTSLGGIATLAVILLSFLLSLNDIGEFLWGWPDFEYGVDKRLKSTLDINVDMIVNMPCTYLTIDVRDAVGDRLHLTSSFRRDGTAFDARQAHRLQSHGEEKSTSEIVTAARKKSGGLFASFQAQSSSYKPTYNHIPSADACRIYGTIQAKRVTGNLHITSLGHGYSSREHTEHKLINFTHVISEFSFGPYFPNIAQPLDYTFEATDDPFTQFQYFVTVVPTTYNAPRSAPLSTNQYSVTSYKRNLVHGRGTPGIFFKYDIDPLEMTVWQRTSSLMELILRLCGVVGGVWVCAGWAVKVTSKAATVVVGKDDDGEIVSEATLRKKASKRWAGGDLRSRTTSNGWQIDGASPYSATFGSPYAGTPTSTYPPTPMTANGNGNGNGHLYAPSPVAVNGGSQPGTPGLHSPYTPGPAVRAPLLRPTQSGASIPLSPSTPPQRSASYMAGSPPSPYPNGPSPARSKSSLNPGADKRMD